MRGREPVVRQSDLKKVGLVFGLFALVSGTISLGLLVLVIQALLKYIHS